MRFDIITIFPELIKAFAKESLLSRAQKKKLLTIGVHNLRDYTTDKHKKVDDKPFGGGLGMVFRVEPVFKAVSTIKSKFLISNAKTKTILFTPRGKKFTQQKAEELIRNKHLILICGRYEGIDERVAERIADEKLSIGDYVLMGGEIPAMAVIETMARLIPGVVGKAKFLKERNLRLSNGSSGGFLEYPEYTRPEVFQKWKAPKVLLSGDHKKIEEWKAKHGRVICK